MAMPCKFQTHTHIWLLLTDMCNIKRNSAIDFPGTKNLRKGRGRLGYFDQLKRWLRERRRQRRVEHPTLSSGQGRYNPRVPWSWRREKVSRTGNGEKMASFPTWLVPTPFNTPTTPHRTDYQMGPMAPGRAKFMLLVHKMNHLPIRGEWSEMISFPGRASVNKKL